MSKLEKDERRRTLRDRCHRANEGHKPFEADPIRGDYYAQNFLDNQGLAAVTTEGVVEIRIAKNDMLACKDANYPS